MEESQSEKIASGLLKIGAVRFRTDSPFTWASGWKSPVYCDNRLTLSYPKLREFIKKEFIDIILNKYPTTEVIAGVATAGIPQASYIADALNLPLIYIRSKPKDHGLENRIEGKLNEGQKVILIEDLISTGGSSYSAVEAVLQSGGQILAVLCVFSYDFEIAKKMFMQANIPVHALTSYPCLVDMGLKLNYIKPTQIQSLKDWRSDPANWGK